MTSYLDSSVAPGAGPLLTADDVAALLGVSRTFVYRLSRCGQLPTVRLGERYVRYRAQTIDEWIAGRESIDPSGTR
jgi:excisionase family DNA binding protein